MLHHNDTALISPKNDEKAFAMNLEKLMTDEKLCEKLSENAQKQLRKTSIENPIEKWISVFIG